TEVAVSFMAKYPVKGIAVTRTKHHSETIRWLAFQDSPSDQSEIPSKAKSLRRNCPGFPERAGKPPALGSHTPGVVARKLSVVRNIPTARALPRADARGENGRAAMRIATATSITPSTAEKPRTLIGP